MIRSTGSIPVTVHSWGVIMDFNKYFLCWSDSFYEEYHEEFSSEKDFLNFINDRPNIIIIRAIKGTNIVLEPEEKVIRYKIKV